MQFSTLLGAACALALSANAVPTPANHVLHEKRAYAPLHWEKLGRVDPAVVLPVRIGLTQNNLEKGPGLLDEV